MQKVYLMFSRMDVDINILRGNLKAGKQQEKHITHYNLYQPVTIVSIFMKPNKRQTDAAPPTMLYAYEALLIWTLTHTWLENTELDIWVVITQEKVY